MKPASVVLSLVLLAPGCTATGRGQAVDGAVVGAAAGAVGGLLTAAIFGGDAGRAAARGAAWGAGTGAVTGAIRGDMAEEATEQRRQANRQARDAAEIQQLRAEIGNDNLFGLDALAQCKHAVALAYAGTAARSANPDFALAAKWLESLVFADQGDRRSVQSLYPSLISADSEIHSSGQADSTVWELLQGLRDVRTRYGMPATCPP